MYIFISREFEMQARALANESKENFNEFKENCFSDIEQKGDRITFLGHGEIKDNKVIFGDLELSPKQFVEKLIEYNLPTEVKTIDLIGCYLGLSQDKLTFLEETVKALHENEKYRHIKVRGFMHVDKEKKYTNMSLTFSSNEGGKIEKLACVLFTEDQAKERKGYDDAVEMLHRRGSNIQNQLNFKKAKVFSNENLKKEIEQLKSNKQNGAAIDEYELAEKETDLLEEKELSRLTQEISNLAEELKAVTQKKEEEYKKYESTFRMYGKPTIIYDVLVEKIREHLDKDICDPEKFLKKKKISSEDKKEAELQYKHKRAIILASILNENKYNEFNEKITLLIHKTDKDSLKEFKKLTKKCVSSIESNKEKLAVLNALIHKTSYFNQKAINFLILKRESISSKQQLRDEAKKESGRGMPSIGGIFAHSANEVRETFKRLCDEATVLVSTLYPVSDESHAANSARQQVTKMTSKDYQPSNGKNEAIQSWVNQMREALKKRQSSAPGKFNS